jgi:tRNA-(ms[2]io[6]A)-hydroxylase
MLKLASATPPGWAAFAAARLDAVLLDHAHCERRAAATALALLSRYPHHGALQAPLAALAREELAHFEEVLGHLARRGIVYRRAQPSPYAGRLHDGVRAHEPERLLDRLLVAALIEARSCERLGLLADAVPDPALAHFYRGLRAAEARHHGVYAELACALVPREAVAVRLDALARHEAEVLARAPVAPRLHDAAEPA